MTSTDPAETYGYEISRLMPTGLDATWAAWTVPDRYGEWFGAISGSVDLDVRTLGSWSLALPSGDEDDPEVMTGEYGDVIPKRLLEILTHFESGDTVMRFEFEPADSGTTITVSQSSPTREQRDGSREGAEMLLGLCAAYLDEPGG
jgi:uncharacterized protein YndB with AHSA1/START domain